jgi:hypothetical protein
MNNIELDIVRYSHVFPDEMVSTYDSTYDSSKHNVIFTWDAETGKIKSVEILK